MSPAVAPASGRIVYRAGGGPHVGAGAASGTLWLPVSLGPASSVPVPESSTGPASEESTWTPESGVVPPSCPAGGPLPPEDELLQATATRVAIEGARTTNADR